MNMLPGVAVLLAYQLVGEMLVVLLALPLPGPVAGMLLLLVTLMVRGGVAGPLEDATNLLLSHLSLLFVPAGVGVMVHFHRLGEEGLAIAMALVLSTFATLAATALIMKGADRFIRGRQGGRG